jgi:class 3 adenylate cyclase
MVTVLFTDMVDWNELLSRQGATVAEEMRRAHFAALREPLAEHGGTEVKTVGEGLMVTFGSATHAVSCAGAMQRAVARLRGADTRSPSVRMGLSLGEATTEEGDWYGKPVIEAARLCEAAGGGEVLTTTVVPLLAAGRGKHRFADLGTRQLKGFATPVAVCRLDWQPDPTTVLSLPPILELVERDSFVGRSAESARTAAAWERARAGTPAAVLVSGEPGIGKTRLAAELARSVHRSGGCVLWGRCDDDMVAPYQPFVEALRRYVEQAPGNEFLPELGRAELARLIPEIAARWPNLGPPPLQSNAETERLNLFEAVWNLLAGVGRTAPVLLVIDDLHWAAKPTLLLLRHLVREQTPARLLIVATYRDSELDRTHPLSSVLADLRRQPQVERLALGGLDEAGVASYVEAAGGHELEDPGLRLAAALHAETEGNPFFVGQILRHLVESGALYQEAGHWTSDHAIEELGLPEGIREVVGRRLSQLSETTNRVLAVAAVAGRDFELRVLEAVLGSGEPTPPLDALEEALAARLVLEVPGAVGRFSFTHALVRQTLYTELSAARRARLHRQVAEALEELPAATPDRVGELAFHFAEAAATGTTDKAIAYARLAAERAATQFAHEDGVRHLERALQLLDLDGSAPGALGAELLLELSRARGASGDVPGAMEAAAQAGQAAQAAGLPLVLAEAAIGRAWWAPAGVADPVSRALLDQAISFIGSDDPVWRSRLLAALAFHRAIGDRAADAARDLSSEAVALARAAGEDESLAWALTARLFTLHGEPDIEQRLSVLHALSSVDVRGRSLWPGMEMQFFVQMMILRFRPLLFLQTGDRPAFVAGLDALHELGQRHSYWVLHATAAMWRGMLALFDGRLADAEAHANDIVAQTQDVNFINIWAAQIGYIRHEQARLTELRPLLEGAAERSPALVELEIFRLFIDAEVGDLPAARANLEKLASDRFAAIPRDSLWSASLSNLATAAARTGATDVAAALHELLEPFSGQLIVMSLGMACHGAADRYLGMLATVLGRYDEADRRFHDALELEGRVDSEAQQARTRVWLARLLLARGGADNRGEAADQLAVSEGTAARLGLTAIGAEATALAAAIG